MAVKFSNNAVTTLSAGISAGATSFTVASATPFPTLASGDWTYVSLTSEVVKVTAISGTTFTCDATSDAHTSGESVELRMTAELLNDFAEDTEALPLDGGTMTGDVSLGDNVKAKFGAGNDLQIYHDSANSLLSNSTGELIIRNNSDDKDIYLQSDDSAGGVTTYLQVDGSTGSVNLRHYGTTKLATTSTGIDVTGKATMDGLVVTGGSLGAGDNNEFSFVGKLAAGRLVSDAGTTNIASINSTYNDDVLELTAGATNTRVSGIVIAGKDTTADSGEGVKIFRRSVPALGIDGNGDISFYEDTGTTPKFFWDASAESLGIGTSSPHTKLHVDGGDVKISSDVGSSNGDGIPTLFFDEGTSDEVIAQISYHGDDESGGNNFIGIGCNGSTATTEALMKEIHQMVIKASGNVGIGTSSPLAPIQVSSANGDFNTTYNSFAGVSAFLSNNGSATQNTLGGAIAFDSPDGNGSKHAAISPVITGTDNNQVGLSFYVHPSATRSASIAEAMRIDSSGNVGIGTTTPTAKLHVDSNNGWAVISSNVGAGGVFVTDPVASDGNGLCLGWNGSNGSGESNLVAARSGNLSGGFRFHDYNSTTDVYSEWMRIHSNGSVGIGTTSPSGLLHLKGDTNTNGAELFLQVNNNNTTDNLGAINFGNNVDTTLSRILSGTAGASNSSYLSFSNSSAGAATERLRIDSTGAVLPGADNTQDFGSTTKRWANVYTGDLHLSNEGSTNEVDGTSGNWTIQEGENDLYIINNKNGKKFKFSLQEIS